MPMFFFYLEIWVVRRKDRCKMAFELLAYLDGAVVKYFFEKLTVYGTITDAGKDSDAVEKAFIQKLSEQEEPKDIILGTTDAVLSQKNLLSSVNRLDHMYSSAGFNDGANSGFLGVAVVKNLPLDRLAVYCKVSTFDDLKSAIKDFDSGMRAFRSNGVESQSNAVEWGGKSEQCCRMYEETRCPGR